MTRKSKIILSVTAPIALLFIIAVLFAIKMYFKPHKDFVASKSDFTVTARQLFDEFSNNEQEAIKKYVSGDKTVQITGIISEVIKESDGTTTLLISQNQGEKPILTCNLESVENSDLLETGNKITLKGQCTGIQGLIDVSVYMIRCAVVEE